MADRYRQQLIDWCRRLWLGAFESSGVVRTLRRLTSTSLLWRIVAGFWTAAVLTRDWLARRLAGVGAPERDPRTLDRLHDLITTSPLFTTIDRWQASLRVGLAESRAGAVCLRPFLSLDVERRVRALGGVLLVATATHTVTALMIGLRLRPDGWEARLAIVAAALLLIAWPSPFAKAWTARRVKESASSES